MPTLSEELSEAETHAIVRRVARRYRIQKGAPYERGDLVQAGWIGALKAKRDYDGSIPLSAYVSLRVQWEINEHLDRAWHRHSAMPGVESQIVSLDAMPIVEREAIQERARRGPVDSREVRNFIRRLTKGMAREHQLLGLLYFARRQTVGQIAARAGIEPSVVSKALRIHVLPHMRGKYRAVLGRFTRLELDEKRPGRTVDGRGREVFRSFQALSEAVSEAG